MLARGRSKKLRYEELEAAVIQAAAEAQKFKEEVNLKYDIKEFYGRVPKKKF